MFACIGYTGIVITNSTSGTYSSDALTTVVPVAKSISHINANIALWANTMTSGVFLYAIDKSGLRIYTYFRAHASTSSTKAGVCYRVIGSWK